MAVQFDRIKTELEAAVDTVNESGVYIENIQSVANRWYSTNGVDSDWRTVLELVLRRRVLDLTAGCCHTSLTDNADADMTDTEMAAAVADTDMSVAAADIAAAAAAAAADGDGDQLGGVLALLTACVRLVHCDLLAATTVVLLLADCFDALPVGQCHRLFAFVERQLAVWCSPVFFNTCKNNLLRMCNDLLRRQCHSQNTVFSGRVLLFLARLFPLAERSGLNVISEFNVDNVLTYDEASDTEPDAILNGDQYGGAADDTAALSQQHGVDDKATVKKTDYNFYVKFWSLQDFFRNPNQCYDRSGWLMFSRYTEDVLTVFSGYHDDKSCVKLSTDQTVDQSQTSTGDPIQYFAKYLTSRKLLHLQLADSTFRRFVLVQFLILFDYLVAQVKFKTESQCLNEEQCGWLDLVRDRVYQLLQNTEPDGVPFAGSIRSLLQHERYWSAWKNDGCTAFTPPSATVGVDASGRNPAAAAASDEPAGSGGASSAGKLGRADRPRCRRRVGDVLRQAHAKKRYLLGNAELSRLWNLCPDNMLACRSAQRDFLPPVESFLEQAISQLHPASMVEPQYRLVNDCQFGWRALRLLSRRCSHYFAAAQKIPNSQAEFLESILKKVAADNAKQVAGSNSALNSTGGADANLTADSIDEIHSAAKTAGGLADREENGAEGSQQQQQQLLHPVSDQLVQQLSEQLVDEGWRKLAPRLGVSIQEVEQLSAAKEAGSSPSPSAPSSAAAAATTALLSTWMSREGAEACQEELFYALGAVKLDSPQIRALFDADVVGQSLP